MYLMEGSKLLDAKVLDGRQEIAKPIVTIIFVPWIFLVFCFFLLLFYTYLELKSMHCSTSFCHKKDSQFDRKKEMEAMNKIIFVSLIYMIH